MTGPTRRPALILAPLALLAAWCPPAPCAAPARVTAGTPLTEFARSSAGKEFYGAYLFSGKVGWISDESHLAEQQGKPVYESSSDMHIELQMLGQRTQKLAHSTTRYSLDGDGAIISISETETDDGNEVQRSAVREGSNLRITTREPNGTSSQRVVPLPRDTLKSQRDMEAWLAGTPRRGERMKFYEADLSQEQVETELVMEFIEATPLVWGGVPVQASRVIMHLGGAEFEALAGPDGRLLRGKIGGLLEIRAEEEQVAKALDARPVDMLAASSIVVAQPLGDRDTLKDLTLELSGLGDYQLPANARQHVLDSGKGRATVELVRETAQPVAVRLTPQERERYLRATPGVQSDDAEIRGLARDIAGDEKDPARIAARIVDWIGRNLHQQYGANATTATAVLRQKAGDCTEHTLLFTALARAAGVPARQLGGIIYVETPAPTFGWHAWAEIHDGSGWISVDPTWHQLRVDPTHVQFSFFGDDMEKNDLAWVQVLGGLKIDVKKVDRD